MRLTGFVEYAAIVIGILGVVAGQHFALPKGVHLGVSLIGAGIALGGVEAVVTRRMPFRLSEGGDERFAGAVAMIVGLMALAVGAGFIAAGYLLAEGQWHATVHELGRHFERLVAKLRAL